MSTTIVVVGGGSAGCALAARLSETPTNHVLLVEAGPDFAPDRTPEDILASYSGRALYNSAYFWPALQARRREGAAPTGYEQARLVGGGSSINGQVALRGAPRDFDRWEELGAAGWAWRDVMPYFRKAETDLDFTDQLHGAEGPIKIRRFPQELWDGFTRSAVAAWQASGYCARRDMNGSFEEGFAALPISNAADRRVSAALGYLDEAVRRRSNLRIVPETEARRLVIEEGRVTAVEARREGETVRIAGDLVVLSAGALRSPWLMLRSGIGPAGALQRAGVTPLLDLPGVGAELQDHPAVSITVYMRPGARRPVVRHNYVNLIYSSGLEGVPSADMVMSVMCKTAWHALGDRLGALSTYVGKPFSRGSVRLSPTDPEAEPEVTFNWLDDERDLTRAVDSYYKMAALLNSEQLRDSVSNPFAVGFTAKVKRVGALTWKNRVLTAFAGQCMDSSAGLRRLIIDRFASDGRALAELLADRSALGNYLRDAATGFWHPSGTCRMGRTDDRRSVVDPGGRVIGIENLFVADASIMPEIPTTNLNLPTIMIGERMADLIGAFQTA